MGGVSSEHLAENEDYYFSPEGLMIMTESYHLKRGYCCENSCKHCPFGFNKA